MQKGAPLTELQQRALTLMPRAPDSIPSTDLIAALSKGSRHCDPRTVRRALEALKTRQLADYTGSTRGRRWFALAPATKNVRPSTEHAVALLTLRRVAQRHLPASVIGALEDDFAGAARVLGEHPTVSTLAAAREWMGKTARLNSGYPLTPPPVDEALFQTVGRALYNDDSLDIVYRKFESGRYVSKQYRVLPYAIIEKGPLWYLVVKNKRRSAEGSFFPLRMDRIQQVTPAGPDLVRDKAFSLEGYIKCDKSMEFFAGEPVEVVLRVREQDHEHLFRSLRLAEDQRIVEQENGFLLIATVAPSVPFMNLLLEKCTSVEVVSPANLRSEIVERLKDALAGYGLQTIANPDTARPD